MSRIIRYCTNLITHAAAKGWHLESIVDEEGEQLQTGLHSVHTLLNHAEHVEQFDLIFVRGDRRMVFSIFPDGPESEWLVNGIYNPQEEAEFRHISEILGW